MRQWQQRNAPPLNAPPLNCTLEVCIDSPAGLHACIEGGADRVELCSALALGGLTPSKGLMRIASVVEAPVFAMIRPRGGNFCFDRAELQVMRDDISAASDAGLAGVVLGAADGNGGLDIAALTQLCKTAGPLKKTLHRVIDTLDNPLRALQQALDLGFDHILTSGCEPSVQQGIALLREMNALAAGKIEIIAGAGLTPALVPQIHAETGIISYHASCSRTVGVDERLKSMGFASSDMRCTDAGMVRRFKEVLGSIDV